MDKKDYGFQYLKYIEVIIEEYLDAIATKNCHYLTLNKSNIRSLLGKRIFNIPLHNNSLRALFNANFLNGGLKPSFKKEFYRETFKNLQLENKEYFVSSNTKNDNSNIIASLEKALHPYKNKILFYAYNERFLKQVLGVLSAINQEVVILTSATISDEIAYPKNIEMIEFTALEVEGYPNEFLKTKFPNLYYLYNSLELIITILNPTTIIVIEGGNIIDYDILASLGAKLKIKTICLQHGWPCIMHMGFRNMPFDYFLTWGDAFSSLFEKVNNKPTFISTGYPFKINDYKIHDKNAISFFFQAPYFILSIPVINQMIAFAAYCAITFPHLEILIREHPANQFFSKEIQSLNKYKNVVFTPSKSVLLDNVLSRSIVSVAVFSSILMESMVYDAIPFVFNPTSMPHYHPDLNKLELGIETTSLNEAKNNIKKLLHSSRSVLKFQANIRAQKSNYFVRTGTNAINNAVLEIIKTANNK